MSKDETGALILKVGEVAGTVSIMAMAIYKVFFGQTETKATV